MSRGYASGLGMNTIPGVQVEVLKVISPHEEACLNASYRIRNARNEGRFFKNEEDFIENHNSSKLFKGQYIFLLDSRRFYMYVGENTPRTKEKL